MKPLKIIVNAFGPYAEEQIIDFSILEERNFFLIHGPTGSGKTSILDAICFALYGETSGGERKTKSIRSDYAYIQDPTEVTFEFLLGDKRFKINRSPEQDRPKKRGDGTTKQLSEATLWQVNGEKKTVLADRWSKVTEEVKILMGFDVDQFRQVVMLPQGQFRKLLLADSADRQIILETLFQTGVYRKIEEALKEAAKKIKNKAEELIKRKEFILEQAEVESVEELLENLKELKTKTVELKGCLDIKRQEEIKAHEKLDNARNIVLKLGEKDKALVFYNKLQNLKEIIEKKRVTLIRGQKAEKLKDAEQNLTTRQEEKKKAIADYENAEKHLIIVKKEKETTEKNYVAEKNKISKINELRIYLNTLEKMVDEVVSLQQAKTELNNATEKTKTISDKLEAKKQEISELAKVIESKKADYEKARENGAKAESISLMLENQQKEYEDLSRVLEIEEKEKKAKRKFENQQENFLKTEKGFLKEKETLRQLESAWVEGQAGILSAKLVENQPCPVCGSTSHPEPALLKRDICDEKTLKEKRAGIKKSEEFFNIEKEKTSELREIYLSFKTQAQTLTGDKESVLNKNPGDLEKIVKETKAALIKSETDNAFAVNIKKDIEALISSEKLKNSQLSEIKEHFNKTSRDKEGLETTYNGRKKNIPEQFKVKSDIEKEIFNIKSQINAFEKSYKEAETQHELLIQKLATSIEKVSTTSDLVANTTETEISTLALFTKNLLKEDFIDFTDYKKSTLKPLEIKELDDEIRDYNENLKAANERLKRAKKEAKNFIKPDLTIFEKAVFQIKKGVEEIVDTKSRIETLEKQKKDLHKQYLDVINKSGSLEKEYSITGRLSEVANGKNSHGMTFQRYVLATLLEDVLYSAGKHLKFMSRGRFDLLRSKERADMRSAGGLDLIVSDSYTGTTRPVNSLSGGESFLASLSLALGLADVVQSYAGGIKLDTIFVDEGFGSLDPETLDLAFKAFSDLQNTGRLVGIISHVPELKERISTRLEVVPGKRGSEARFVL